MDGKQAAIVVREYFEGISGICPVVFQTHSITRVDAGYEVMCGVCSAMVHGAKYRGLVGMDGKLAKIDRVDMHPGSIDVDVVPDSIIIGNLRRINTRQHKQICDHCETIGGLRATISELEERDARKTTAIDELQKTIEEMKSKVAPPNLAVMALLHNLNVKIEALEAELRDEMQQKHVAIRLGAEKAATVSRLNETIDDLGAQLTEKRAIINEITRLRVNEVETREALEAELSARKDDSKVLMQVVEAVKIWEEYQYKQSIPQIANIVEDYLDVHEIPDWKETGVITDQVIDEALDTIVSNMFNETAGAMQTAIAHQDRRIKHLDAQIDKKSVFISSLLRNDKRLNRLLDERRADVRGRDKIIESLRVDVADQDKHIDELENRVGMLPENFWVVVGQLRDANRQQTTTIDGLEETLKLERIDHTAEVSAITNTLNETIKALRTDVSDRDRHIEESGVRPVPHTLGGNSR